MWRIERYAEPGGHSLSAHHRQGAVLAEIPHPIVRSEGGLLLFTSGRYAPIEAAYQLGSNQRLVKVDKQVCSECGAPKPLPKPPSNVGSLS